MPGVDDLITALSGPTGLKQLYDMTMADNATIAEIAEQEKSGKPIDIEAARRVVQNIDTFMEAIQDLPWAARMTIGTGKLKKVQEQTHEHLKILEEKAKIQGVVVHTPPTSTIIPNEIPRVTEVTKDNKIITEIPEEIPSTLISSKISESIKEVKDQSTNASPLSSQQAEDNISPTSESNESVAATQITTEKKQDIIKTIATTLVEPHKADTIKKEDQVLPDEVLA